MIVIHSGLKREFIIELLDGRTIESISFKYIRTEGMKILFDISEDKNRMAEGIVKKEIRSTDIGRVLFFRVETVD